MMGDELGYIVEGLRGLAVPIDQVHEDAANARTGHAVDRIAGSLRVYGQRKPIVANRLEGGKVVAGNGTLRAARSLGWGHIAVVWVDDDAATAAGFGIADNRVGDLSGWDVEALESLMEALPDDAFTGFEAGELEELLGDAGKGAGGGDAEPQIDRADELRQRWGVELGQLWRLPSRTPGQEHRLICGDCTDGGVVERVMGGERADMVVTDPPYAIYGSSTGIGGDVTDDNMVRPFMRLVTGLFEQITRYGAHIYTFCDWRSWASWWQEFKPRELIVRNCIVWDKGDGGLGSNYTMRHEFIIFAEHTPKAVTMTAAAKSRKSRTVNGRANVQRFNVPQNDERFHNAAKPLELLKVFIDASSDVGDVLFDPFSGSGTTLIACENLGRQCRAVEVSPGYVAVALQRYVDAFGIEPVLVGDG